MSGERSAHPSRAPPPHRLPTPTVGALWASVEDRLSRFSRTVGAYLADLRRTHPPTETSSAGESVRSYSSGATASAPSAGASSGASAGAIAACFLSSRFCCFRARRSLTACSLVHLGSGRLSLAYGHSVVPPSRWCRCHACARGSRAATGVAHRSRRSERQSWSSRPVRPSSESREPP